VATDALAVIDDESVSHSESFLPNRKPVECHIYSSARSTSDWDVEVFMQYS
jgi:hypothetical protein